MTVSYNKLWKLLIDKNMKKKELGKIAGVSPSLIAKLGRNENVTGEVLVKICEALECGMDEIMEIVPIEDRELKRG
ncbi:MAG: helix-turn-helix transcriptional regulator [Erysipelotrichaceae bacterium]